MHVFYDSRLEVAVQLAGLLSHGLLVHSRQYRPSLCRQRVFPFTLPVWWSEVSFLIPRHAFTDGLPQDRVREKPESTPNHWAAGENAV